jgi:VWFA-related protein
MNLELQRTARRIVLSRRVRSATVTLLVGGLAADLSAQAAADSGVVERVDVELVNVEAWPTDRKGNFVSGLTADDFVLLHDGEVVPIDFFSEIRDGVVVASPVTGGSAEADGVGDVSPAAGTTAPESHLIVYFDELNLHPASRGLVVDALREVVASRGIAPERILVLRQAEGLTVAAPFGSGADELDGAFDALAEGGGQGAAFIADTELAIQEIRQLWATSQETAGSAASGLAGVPNSSTLSALSGDTGGGPAGTVGGAGTGSGGVGGGLAPEVCEIMIQRTEPMIEGYTRQRSAQIALTLERLSEAVTFLAGLDGVKTLLYVSDRLETTPGVDVASVVQSYCPTAQPSYLVSTLGEQMSQTFEDVTRHANANRVTFYTLQGRGLVGDVMSSAKQRGEAMRGGSSAEGTIRSTQLGGLMMLADETGGRAVYNTNNLAQGIEEIGREINTYYSLAYRAPEAAEPGRHEIEVLARDKSIEVRHRVGYLDKTPEQRLTERLLGVLNLGLVSNPLDVRLGVGDIVAAAEGRYRLPLRILVPAASLVALPTDGSLIGSVRCKVMAHDSTQGALVTQERNVKVKLPEERADQWVPLSVEVDLSPGVHTIAVGVVDSVGGGSSFISTTLEVGDAATGEPGA